MTNIDRIQMHKIVRIKNKLLSFGSGKVFEYDITNNKWNTTTVLMIIHGNYDCEYAINV